jgi:plastocyanin
LSIQSSTVVGVVVVVLILGAVATIGYYQTQVAPFATNTTTTTGPPAVACPSAKCVNVTIPNGASTTAPGYGPATVTVVIGVNNTLYWINGDTTGTPHTVTARDNSWGSGSMNQGDTYQHTFTAAGTYNYYCTFHPTVMKGTVIVKSG